MSIDKFTMNDFSESPKNSHTEDNEKGSLKNSPEDEKEITFQEIKKPFDVLKLPHYLREEGLNTLKERLAKKQLRVSKLQKDIFDYIRLEHAKGTLSKDSLTRHVDEIFDDPIFTRDDRELVETILYYFNRSYSIINSESRLSDSELLSKYSGGRLSESNLNGSYKIIRNPFSFDFSFGSVYDFRIFIEKKHNGQERKTSIIGLSYYYEEVPLTASLYHSETTMRHEIQHKEFSSINIDTIYSDSELERNTRDELLSFYIQDDTENDFKTIDSILIGSYKFHEKEGVDERDYRKMILGAVKAIRDLEEFFSTKDEVINILRRSPLHQWGRITKRLINSEVIKSKVKSLENLTIVEKRKKKKEESAKRLSEFNKRIKEKFIDSIKELLSEPLIFKRHINQKGKFYAPINKKVIVDFLRKKMDTASSYKIKEKNIILDSDIEFYGTYSFNLSFGEDKINGLIQVLNF
jgi:ribosomal protein L9